MYSEKCCWIELNIFDSELWFVQQISEISSILLSWFPDNNPGPNHPKQPNDFHHFGHEYRKDLKKWNFEIHGVQILNFTLWSKPLPLMNETAIGSNISWLISLTPMQQTSNALTNLRSILATCLNESPLNTFKPLTTRDDKFITFIFLLWTAMYARSPSSCWNERRSMMVKNTNNLKNNVYSQMLRTVFCLILHHQFLPKSQCIWCTAWAYFRKEP